MKFTFTPRWFLLLLGLLTFAVGCEPDSVVDKGWQPMRPLGRDVQTSLPAVKPDISVKPAEAMEPTGPLTLNKALVLAMLYSPELSGASWEVRMAEARTLQASLPPNPEVGFDFESVSSPLSAESVLSLGQVIFLSDKLERQTQAAALERDVTGWDWEARRIRVYTETTKAFVALVAAQERVSIADEIVLTSQKLLEVTLARVRSGKAAPLEEMKAKVELCNVRADWEQARQVVLATRQRLAASWGGLASKFTKAEGRMDVRGDTPSAEKVFSLFEQNPEVARWATEMQRRHAVVLLEKRKAIPDLFLGGGAKSEKDGSDVASGYVIGAAIQIPIFDRNQGGIKESQYDVPRGYEEERATKARVLAEIAEAYHSMAAAYARSVILGEQVVPEAQKAFDAATAGYKEGKFTYLDVLDAQRTVFNARVQQNESLAEYLASVADVEGLIGQSIDEIEKTNTSDAAALSPQEK